MLPFRVGLPSNCLSSIDESPRFCMVSKPPTSTATYAKSPLAFAVDAALY